MSEQILMQPIVNINGDEKNLKAKKYLEQARIYHERYLIRKDNADLQDAIDYYIDAVKYDPTIPETYYRLASLMWEQGQISINGIVLDMIDTAGIRETEDKIEAIGVEKSLKIMSESDLVLFMLNNNEELTEDIKELLSKLDDKKYILIINKNDLETKLDRNKINIPEDKIVNISVMNNQGIDELKYKIINMFNINELETKDPTYLSNSRSISIIKRCLNKVEEVEESIKNNMPIDMIELDIKNIWEELGKVNGTTYEEELLDEMFSRFCLGK